MRTNVVRGLTALALLGLGTAHAGPAVPGPDEGPYRARVDELLGALPLSSDPAWSREATVHEIAECGPTVIPTLIRWLDSGRPGAVRAATHALGLMASRYQADVGPAIPSLIGVLYQDDPNLHIAALMALSMHGADAREVAWKVADLIRQARPQRNVRKVAAAYFGKLGAAGVPPLLELLHDQDRVIRLFAVVALDRIGPPAAEAIPDLAQVFHDPDYDFRVQVAMALTNMAMETGDPRAVEALTAGLFDERQMMQARLLDAFARMGPKAKVAVPSIRKLLTHPNRSIANEAVRALAAIEGEQSVYPPEVLKRPASTPAAP